MPELIKSKSLITYLYKKARATSLWSAADRTITYARRFLFLTRIFRYVSIGIAVIETSAILFLLAALLIIAIPAVLIALVIFAAADFVIGGRILKSPSLARELSRGRIYVIAGAGAFGEGLARQLRRRGAAVFVLTASPKRRFVSAVCEGGVYYVRHAFFFRLKRRHLEGLAERMIYLT